MVRLYRNSLFPLMNSTSPATQTRKIQFQGVRTNNLKNIDADFEHGTLTVLTGPSGCGKSSLAFDTLYAEGKRQFLDSLSIQARQNLQFLPRPEFDSVLGLQPVVCIEQKKSKPNSRATVGTVTEIYDHLRLLMSRIGTVCCSNCQTPIDQTSTDEIEQAILELPERTKLVLLAPFQSESESLPTIVSEIRKAGYVRARIGTEIFDLDSVPENEPLTQNVDAVIDRIIVKPGIEDRLSESVSQALKLGNGKLSILALENSSEDWLETKYSTHYACAECGNSYEEIETRTFSFNSPFGACVACEGTGTVERFLQEHVLYDGAQTLFAQPIHSSLAGETVATWQDELRPLLQQCEVTPETVLRDLDEACRNILFYGDNNTAGLQILLEKVFVTTTDKKLLESLAEFRGPDACPTCNGSRLCEAANNVFVDGKNIGEITQLSVDKALKFFGQLESRLDEEKQVIAEPIVKEVTNRLNFLQDVGAEYLTLHRRADSLSGGEFQRVRLATGLGNRLTDVCYILDEPTVGLHRNDIHKLIQTMKQLQKLGNSLVVVEHDAAVMKVADRILDLGPGAGAQGGEVVLEGSYADLASSDESLTAKHLQSRQEDASPNLSRTLPAKESWITIAGPRQNNLKGDTFQFPTGRFVCVSGVSGSGKSSLVNQTLVPAMQRNLGLRRSPGPYDQLTNAELIQRVTVIDQNPIGRSPRSNAATFTGMFDEIRKVFSATKLAKQLGYTASRFSFNNKTGACQNCGGHGLVKVDMSFMPDIYSTCESCGGKRYNPSTLGIQFKNLNIAEVLELSVDDAHDIFQNIEKIDRTLRALQQAGLGYLNLGQPATSLSGGEAQRLKIASHLANQSREPTLFVLDEPTAGLHFADQERLFGVLQGLVDQEHTVMVIEHNLGFIRRADYVIDFGPVGGEQGGFIVGEGTPDELAQNPQSVTGQYLQGE